MSNNTFLDEELSYNQAELIAYDVLFTIFIGIGIILNVTEIYIINRFKQLKAIPNLLFSNWALADTASLLTNPSSYRFISTIDSVTLDRRLECAVTEVDLVFHDVAVLFMIIISIDWFIAACCPSILKKIRRYGKWVIFIVWCLSGLLAIIVARLCIRKTIKRHVTLKALTILYLALLLCVIINQILRCTQKCRKLDLRHTTITLGITTTYTACWFIVFLFFFFADFFHVHPMLAFLTECPIFGSSIINFVLMYRYNSDFQACLLQLLTRPADRYTENITELETCENHENITASS